MAVVAVVVVAADDDDDVDVGRSEVGSFLIA